MDKNPRKQCRTCLRHYESRMDMVSLLDFDQTMPLKKIKFSEMLSSVSSCEILLNDQLPKRVCLLCLSQIRNCYHFRDQVERSRQSLLQQLSLKSSNINLACVKEEPGTKRLPIILSPRHVMDESFTDDMLLEIDRNGGNESDQEIIDYEPEQSYDDETDIETPLPKTPSSKQKQIQHDEKKSVCESPVKKVDTTKIIRVQHEKVMEKVSSKDEEEEDIECRVCKKSFKNLKVFKFHKQFLHMINKCRHCNKKFLNGVQLKLHTRFKHPDKYNEHILNYEQAFVEIERLEHIDECFTCHKMFVDQKSLLKHHATCDGKCIECGLKFPQQDLYYKHLETIHSLQVNPKVIECPFCMIKYDSDKKLEEHIQRSHPEEMSVDDSISETCASTSNDGFLFECHLCSASFSSAKSLNQHKAIKHKSGQKGTEELEVKTKNVPKFSRDEFMEKHLVKKSNDFYRCLPCGKEIFKRSLLLHLRSKHSAIRSFRCELCPEAYFRADYRQRHMAVSHPNSFKCLTCEIQYDRAYKFDAHMHSVHDIPAKNFKPEEGDDHFDLSPNMIKYIENSKNYDYTDDYLLLRPNTRAPSVLSTATITEIPLSKEDFCDKYFISKSERVTYCNVCQQEIQKSSIISHLLWKHAIQRPLKCAFCNERVVKNNARLSHMGRCHPNEYKCFDCNIQYAKHQQIADHMFEVHNSKYNIAISSGEEEDLPTNDVRFVTNKNEDEVIDEMEVINTNVSTIEERKFACAHCPKSFTSSKNLLIHKSHKHRNESSELALQNLSAAAGDSMSFDEFQNNWIEEVNETDTKCLVCDLTMKEKNLSNHLKARHSTSGAYLCEICREAFYRPEQRSQHMNAQHRGMFYCDNCNIQFYRNSRYVKHMKELHDIELMDSKDRFEVDLNLCDLRFVPTVRRNHCDQNAVLSMIYNECSTSNESIDPIEDMISKFNNDDLLYGNTSSTEGYSRGDFMTKYFKNSGKDTKYCSACNKNFQASSVYHHLIHFHASIFPFKCAFCDLRLERSNVRSRHMQVFHPNEYKCITCGIQFQKFIKYADHMMVEHSISLNAGKSPLEEEDISTSDIRYVPNRITEDSMWQEQDVNPIGNSTMISAQHELEPLLQPHCFKTPIKSEVVDDEIITHHSFPKIDASIEESLPYQEFKNKYLRNIDGLTFECKPCNRMVIRTSVCAHLRLWHATKMMYNCELCTMGFRRQDYRQRHVAAAHPNQLFCEICQQQFVRTTLYKEHMWSEHKTSIHLPELKPRDEIDVPLENMMFAVNVPDSERSHEEKTNSRLAGRKRRHSVCDERPINPSAGGLTFTEFLNTFIREENESFVCVVCNEHLSKLSLKKHLKKYHATSRPYNCEICSESFKRINERVAHMHMIHPDSLKCSICDRQFHLSSIYMDHMRAVHNTNVNIRSNKIKSDVDVPIERLRFIGKRLDESSTPSTSSAKINKNDHLSVPDDAEMTREQFTKKFLRAIRPSAGDPQSNCTACDKVFSSKNRYFHVLHNHVVNRPYGCEFCSLRFFTTFKRIQHMNLKHAKENKCETCMVQFERSNKYAQHLKEEHGINLEVANNFDDLDVLSSNLRFTKKSTAVRVLMREQQRAEKRAISLDSSYYSLQEKNCEICNIEFDSSRSFRQHMRDHAVLGVLPIPVKQTLPQVELPKVEPPREYQFQCHICEKKFLALFALNAHKKFKHFINSDNTPLVSKQRNIKQKFEVNCEICSFSSFRRDYVEHHNKQAHKGEFQCHACDRILSGYNSYIHHIKVSHTKCKLNLSKQHKCMECKHDKYFKFEESLSRHQKERHGSNQLKNDCFCEYCHLLFRSKSLYECHLEGYKHKAIQGFFDRMRSLPKANGSIKIEKQEEKLINEDEDESVSKRPRLDVENAATSDEDKLEYLKYLQHLPNGSYKCTICSKTKATRKFLLHHLKQHEEIPTFNCTKCPERFVFKRKFEKHLLMHENGSAASSEERSTDEHEMIENEHPKFQDMKKTSTEIRCSICDTNFKLTIQLNKHNTTWHGEENPNKELSMQVQKNKSKEFIKILRCKYCIEAFMKADDLKNHMKLAHESELNSTNEQMKFTCKKCNLSFNEKQYLENHQKLFCIHRNIEADKDRNDEQITLNEQ